MCTGTKVRKYDLDTTRLEQPKQTGGLGLDEPVMDFDMSRARQVKDAMDKIKEKQPIGMGDRISILADRLVSGLDHSTIGKYVHLIKGGVDESDFHLADAGVPGYPLPKKRRKYVMEDVDLPFPKTTRKKLKKTDSRG